ncbi:hypothetical protein LPJ53_004976 [Coemansia erecta]|uniref:Uncharacterized protein n=1 Tax=Coemansia erecta TaxID=147472 RepID=A0A9W8CP89_9FUNG|nr:hypothetical protein LPJ53_004976 [Coemansia erecta]
MDDFINNIESQVIPLTVIDTQGSFSNIPFVFIYENKTGSSAFMQSEPLRNSFFATMQQVPMFAGRIKTKGRGRVSIAVNKNNINMPDYRESSSDVHFDNLKAAGYRWSSWPQGVNTAGPMTKADDDGEVKLINVHVVRLKSNSGVMIYASMAHYAVDGPAHMEVVRRWCQNFRLIEEDRLANIASLPSFMTDRSLIQNRLSNKRVPVHEETEKTFTGFSLFAEWLAWISPKLRGRIISKVVDRQNTETHIFHISSDSFKHLRDSVSKHIPNACNLADNDLVLALATKTMAQAQQAVNNRSQGMLQRIRKSLFAQNVSKIQPVAVIFEVREHLGLSEKYAGNVLIPKIAITDFAELTTRTSAESLAKAVVSYEPITRTMSPAYIASHFDMVTSCPSSFARPISRFMRHKSAISFVYDVMPNMYEADFGHGRPEWVSPIQPFRANAVLLLTHKDPSDGIDVFMTAYPNVMREILTSKSWADVAKIIY